MDEADQVIVDRVTCTGHGVCAVLAAQFELDEFGYPIASRITVDRKQARALADACPARALLLGSAVTR